MRRWLRAVLPLRRGARLRRSVNASTVCGGPDCSISTSRFSAPSRLRDFNGSRWWSPRCPTSTSRRSAASLSRIDHSQRRRSLRFPGLLATLGSVAASTLRRRAAAATQLFQFYVATLGNVEASLLSREPSQQSSQTSIRIFVYQLRWRSGEFRTRSPPHSPEEFWTQLTILETQQL